MTRTTLSAVALCGALALAACGSSDTADGSTNTATASSSASSSPTSNVVTSAQEGDEVDGADLVPFVLAAMEEAGSLHVDTGDGTAPGEGEYDVVLAGEKPDLATVIDGEELRVVGGTVYTRDGDAWAVQETESDGGQMMALAVGLFSVVADPRIIIGGLETEPLTVAEASGSSTVFSGTAAAAQGSTDLRLTVGADGLPTSLEITEADAPMTITYSTWGEVTVEAPEVG